MTVALMVAACGGGGGGDDDGTSVDAPAGVDADGSDGGVTGTVAVVVMEEGVAVEGARVYFQRADQSLVAAVDTDAAGMVSAEAPAGAWVSVLAPYLAGGRPWIETVGGVEPGDVLRFDSPRRVSVDLTVSIPKDPGAASYEVYANCHDEHASSVVVADANTAAFDFAQGACPAAIDFLVISRDAGGARLKWLFAPDRTPVANAVAITGTYTAAMRTVTLSYTNVPVDTAQLTAQYQLVSPDDARVLFADVVALDSFPGQMASTTLTVPDGVGAGLSAPPRIRARASVGRPGNGHHIVDGLVATDGSAAVDFATALSGFASEAQYDRDAGTITWTASDGTPRDLAFAFLTQSRTVGAETISWYRTVVQPHTGAQIVIPRLPVETVDYNVTSADNGAVVELAMAKVPGGYGAIRARFFTTFNPFIAPSHVDAGERALLVEAR